VRWRTDRRIGNDYASHHSIRLAPHGTPALRTEQVMSIGTILLLMGRL
jgi:hypothetical protein